MVDAQAAQANVAQQAAPPRHPYTRASITTTEVQALPIFENDYRDLPLFVENCEEFIRTYVDLRDNNNPINSYLLKLVKSRLVGDAKHLISTRACKTWPEIKELLESNFGDQRTEENLFNDLINFRSNKTRNYHALGEEIRTTLCLLLAKCRLTILDVDELVLKENQYKKVALNTYLRNLNSLDKNLADRIRFRNPVSLEVAMGLIVEEMNWEYGCMNSYNSNMQSQSKLNSNLQGLSKVNANMPGYSNFNSNVQRHSKPNVYRNNIQGPPKIVYQPIYVPFSNNVQNKHNFGYQNIPSNNQFLPNSPINQNPKQQFSTDYNSRFPTFHQSQTRNPNSPSQRFAKSPRQLMQPQRYRQTPMEVDPSFSGIRLNRQLPQKMTPFGPSGRNPNIQIQEIHQEEVEDEDTFVFTPQHNSEDYEEDETHEFYEDETEEYDQNFPLVSQQNTQT